jgi:hypothetical protein
VRVFHVEHLARGSGGVESGVHVSPQCSRAWRRAAIIGGSGTSFLCPSVPRGTCSSLVRLWGDGPSMSLVVCLILRGTRTPAPARMTGWSGSVSRHHPAQMRPRKTRLCGSSGGNALCPSRAYSARMFHVEHSRLIGHGSISRSSPRTGVPGSKSASSGGATPGEAVTAKEKKETWRAWEK